MRLFTTSILIPLLGLFAMGCTSTTALQSSETDDLYYAATDKTTRPDAAVSNYNGALSNAGNTGSGEVQNPEYSESSGQTSITNNYNYYDADYGYSRRVRSARNYSFYSYDPFYSPFGYSAAYCYSLYDPFWYPYCYPAPGFSVSIGYGWGYGGYGWGGPSYGYYYDRPWGYGGYYGYGRPYGGGYYQGFYDGYYAGNGYGINRRNVNYAPRGDRSNVPATQQVNTGGGAGRPAMPGRQATSGDPGRVATTPNQPAGRPQRATVAQPGTAQPNQAQPEGRPQMNSRPQQEGVRPENYQFQQAEEPARPTKTRDTSRPNFQQNVPQQQAPQQQQQQPDVRPERPAQQVAPERPVQQQQDYGRPQRPSRPQYNAPAQENNNSNYRNNTNTNYERPAYRNESPSYSPGGGGSSQPSSAPAGRPRR